MLVPPEHDGDRHRTVGPATFQRSRPRPRFATLAALSVTVTIALSAATCGGSGQARVGEPAPPLAGTTLDGEPFDLADYRGRPVVVNYWASWCKPCRNEFPLFAERLETLGASDNLAVVGVLYDDDPGLAQRFLDDFGATWPTVDDPDDVLAAAYRVVAPPQTYFIDAGGILRGIQIGEVRPGDFDTQYAKIRP